MEDVMEERKRERCEKSYGMEDGSCHLEGWELPR